MRTLPALPGAVSPRRGGRGAGAQDGGGQGSSFERIQASTPQLNAGSSLDYGRRSNPEKRDFAKKVFHLEIRGFTIYCFIQEERMNNTSTRTGRAPRSLVK